MAGPDEGIGAVSRGAMAMFCRRRTEAFKPAIHRIFAAEIGATYEELKASGANTVDPLDVKP
jgi:hypothetical protein